MMLSWVLVLVATGPVAAEECDGAWMLQSRAAKVNTTSLGNGCLQDKWDTSPWHKSPFAGALKRNFHRLYERISQALNSEAVPCKHVTISAGLFCKKPLLGRNNKDEEVGKPAEYTGPAGCGIFIMNDWRITMLEGYTGGWHLIPFSADGFLHKLPEDSKSNEIQRLYNLLKIAAPLYVPEAVQQVTFGDEKCNLPAFAKKVESAIPGFDIYTFQHPHFFQKSLKREFVQTTGLMSQRNESWRVLDDIDRLQRWLGDRFLSAPYELADIMCMTWKRSEAVATFARRWFWYTTTFTMRPQLTWNPALLDCGQALKVKYMLPIDPLF